jgi:hypothetical protein
MLTGGPTHKPAATASERVLAYDDSLVAAERPLAWNWSCVASVNEPEQWRLDSAGLQDGCVNIRRAGQLVLTRSGCEMQRVTLQGAMSALQHNAQSSIVLYTRL